MILSAAEVRDLAMRRTGTPTLSVYVPRMLMARAVEYAVISAVEVATLQAEAPEPARSGGATALLRC
jgi:hypothetical protein